MLENMRKIDWAELEISSGDAARVPKLIEDLTSDDEDLFEESMLALSTNLCEHGIVFDGTIAAIPFLIELLEEDAALDPAAVIDLLAQIAESKDITDLLLPPVHDYAFMQDEGEPYTKDEQEMQWSRDAYDAIAKGLPIYRRLLRDEDPLVRTSAAALIELYPSEAAENARALRTSIDEEEDIPAMTDLMLSLRDILSSAHLSETEQTPYVEFFAALFANETDPTLRLAAAISVARLNADRLSDDMLNVIADALSNPAPYSTYMEDTLENPIHEAMLTLLELPAPRRRAPLMQCLRDTVDTINARNLALALFIEVFGTAPLENLKTVEPNRRTSRNWMGVVTDEASAQGEMVEIPLRKELSDDQREALEVLIDSDAFWRAPGNLLYAFGLPTSRNLLLAYLDDPESFAST
jgi:hypothetical protein